MKCFLKLFSNSVSQFKSIADVQIKETIPSNVVKILQYGHEEQKKRPLEKININRIDKKILEKLMPFQKSGVQ